MLIIYKNALSKSENSSSKKIYNAYCGVYVGSEVVVWMTTSNHKGDKRSWNALLAHWRACSKIHHDNACCCTNSKACALSSDSSLMSHLVRSHNFLSSACVSLLSHTVKIFASGKKSVTWLSGVITIHDCVMSLRSYHAVISASKININSSLKRKSDMTSSTHHAGIMSVWDFFHSNTCCMFIVAVESCCVCSRRVTIACCTVLM